MNYTYQYFCKDKNLNHKVYQFKEKILKSIEYYRKIKNQSTHHQPSSKYIPDFS